MWFDFRDQPTSESTSDLIRIASESEQPPLIPVWPHQSGALQRRLESAGYEIRLTQELMQMSMDDADEFERPELQLRKVDDAPSAAEWTSIASESFGYPIDEPVIEGLMNTPGCHLLLARKEESGETVGTGMLLETEGTAGLHMLGVPREHRRKGYARQIMHALLGRAREMECDLATLQASAAGAPLYEELGFSRQGPVHSYGRPA